MAAAADVESNELPVNVHLSSAPDSALGHDATITKAEQIFHDIVPGEEFCPPAPNPEDIIYDGEGTAENAESTLNDADDAANDADSAANDLDSTGDPAKEAEDETVAEAEEELVKAEE